MCIRDSSWSADGQGDTDEAGGTVPDGGGQFYDFDGNR